MIAKQINAYLDRCYKEYPPFGRSYNFVRDRLKTQSPIETAFIAAWVAGQCRWPSEQLGCVTYAGEPFPWAGKPSSDLARLDISAQVKIGRDRVDFLLVVTRTSGVVVQFVIECDGHNFHDRTAEQGSADRRRDRRLLRAGYVTLRFTFTDIVHDTSGCMADLWQTIVAYSNHINQHAKKEGGE